MEAHDAPLRQRRQQQHASVLQKVEHYERRVVLELSHNSKSRESGANGIQFPVWSPFLLIFLVALSFVVYMINPATLLYNTTKHQSRLLLAGMYPSHISPKRDLPLVVREYAIATLENLPTRRAIQYVLAQRKILTSPSRKVIWKLWEQQEVEFFVQMEGPKQCGGRTEFPSSPEFLQNDLVVWCLLRRQRNQGIIHYGMEFHQSLGTAKNIAIRYLDKTRISTSLIVLTNSRLSHVPSQVVEWLLQQTVTRTWTTEDEYRIELEKHLYRWIAEDSDLQWTILDAVCGDDEFDNSSRSKLATFCHSEDDCCDLWDLSDIQTMSQSRDDDNNRKHDHNNRVTGFLLRH